MLDKKEINHLADLARLSLSEVENESLQRDLEGILGYVNQLAEAKIDNLPDASIGLSLNEVREDGNPVVNKDIAQDIISQFPQKEGRNLKIPPVF
ncbi:MAG TPA: Asp-tRNA(Asn)/Glu-tRNA(Gln) amidotransferase subunit GatC [Candidatus Paceibacterota bacterium]|nr:Asp-tRNA(Asn)/Glu-tRNA(Gln) amidotransferase subunit GatC [Candidatus Paceibacterota bacterium]